MLTRRGRVSMCWAKTCLRRCVSKGCHALLWPASRFCERSFSRPAPRSQLEPFDGSLCDVMLHKEPPGETRPNVFDCEQHGTDVDAEVFIVAVWRVQRK